MTVGDASTTVSADGPTSPGVSPAMGRPPGYFYFKFSHVNENGILEV